MRVKQCQIMLGKITILSEFNGRYSKNLKLLYFKLEYGQSHMTFLTSVKEVNVKEKQWN